jgi:glycosyltransferase involved in cell wall biosynthesis
MKIGIDARGAILYRGTGIGTYTYQLIKNLNLIDKRNGYRFFWPGDEFQDLDISNDEIFQSIEAKKDKFWEEVHVPTRVEQEKIDIFHVPQNGIGLPRTKGCLQVATVHDLIPYIYPETSSAGYLKVFLKEMPRIMEQSDMIITVSEYSKKDIQRYFNLPDEKITVIYEAPESIYQPIEKSVAKEFVSQEYGINNRYVLYIGGLSHRKNIKNLILAFWNIQKDIPEDYKLVIVGKRERSFKKLNDLIGTLNLEDKIIFTDFVKVPCMPYLYSAADLFVYPSLYEGFGLPPLEAMACGTPVITSNLTSIPEVTSNAALLINPNDHISLASGIEKVLNHPEQQEQMSIDGLKQASKFSWESCARETLGVYEKLYKTKM